MDDKESLSLFSCIGSRMSLTGPSTLLFCEERSFYWSSFCGIELLSGSLNNYFICDSLAVIESNGIAFVFQSDLFFTGRSAWNSMGWISFVRNDRAVLQVWLI